MILLWVALSITVLLGMGALTIDLGALYLEKRQLQNGADAAALAIAFNCATGSAAIGCGSVMAVANKMADDNSHDGASAVPLVCGVGPGLSAAGCSTPSGLTGTSNWVQVFTSTENAGGGTQVPMVLAPLLGAAGGKTVKANAIAQWGGVQSVQGALPIVIPACEYLALGGALDGSSFPSGSATIYFHSLGAAPIEPGVGAACTSTSGPNGFGWVNSSNCRVDLSAGAWYNARVGTGVPSGCRPRNWVTGGTDLLLGLYDESEDTSSGRYHLVGFVSFKVTAVNFGRRNTQPRNFVCPATPDNTGICIQGTFTKMVKSGGVPGGPNLGVTTIKLIG